MNCFNIAQYIPRMHLMSVNKTCHPYDYQTCTNADVLEQWGIIYINRPSP